MNTITLTPAYGRDYKSKAAVLADWDANKDFMVNHISHGGYVNKAQLRDLKHDGFTAITFRFARCTKGFIINI
jgi:hypothetical protein